MSLPEPVDARLRELADRYSLSRAAPQSLAAILAALADDEHAPSPIRRPQEAVDAHVADSLVALSLSEVREAQRIADLGSGVGFPGLALAAALPSAHVFLVEPLARRVAWLSSCVVAAALPNVTVVHARAETWREGLDRCDVVAARALASLPVLVEYAAPLLAAGGMLVAWKGAAADAEARDGAFAATRLGLEDLGWTPVIPFPGARDRRLWRFRKIAPTPPGFPRRAGIATKRPLSAPTS